jgi:hypothetical protein
MMGWGVLLVDIGLPVAALTDEKERETEFR